MTSVELRWTDSFLKNELDSKPEAAQRAMLELLLLSFTINILKPQQTTRSEICNYLSLKNALTHPSEGRFPRSYAGSFIFERAPYFGRISQCGLAVATLSLSRRHVE